MRDIAVGEQGFLAMSIATSLAFQGLLGMDEEGNKVGKPRVSDYQYVLVNLRTLVRNYVGSLKSEVVDQVTLNEATDMVASDARVITEIIRDYGQDKVGFLLYDQSYQGLQKILPYAEVRTEKDLTPNQAFIKTTEDQIIANFKKKAIDYGFVVNEGDCRIPFTTERRPKALVLTHMAVDLLDARQFIRLDLLESHTGAIKPKAEWNTKLRGKKENLLRMPFNHGTVSIFGDSGNLVNGQSIRIKRMITKLSQDRDWTTNTTVERIVFSINHALPKEERDVLLPFFKVI